MQDFRFHVIKLWEVSVEELEQTGLLGLLPLMVLARGGKQRKVVEKAIETIETTDDEDKRDLLSLTYIFAALAFVKETDKHWLQRRFRMFEDALKDSWAYQEIWQGGKLEGIEQGKQGGLLEGIQLGKLEGMKEERIADAQRQRHMLEYLVETKFPALLPLAKKRGEASTDPDVLQALTLRLLRAGEEQEAKQILSE